VGRVQRHGHRDCYTPSGSNIWTLWLADANGAVRTYLKDDSTDTIAEGSIQPGYTISFTATELKDYEGTLEITQMSAITKGTPGKVYVQEAAGQTLSAASHFEEMVHAYGKLVSDSTACGGSSVCFDYDIGEQTVTFRVKSSGNLMKGDCVDVYAPMGQFSGSPQFDIANFDWMDTY